MEFGAGRIRILTVLCRCKKGRPGRPRQLCTRAVQMTDPQNREALVQGVRQSIAAAARVGCKTLIYGRGRYRRAEGNLAPADRGGAVCLPMLEESGTTLVIASSQYPWYHIGNYLSASWRKRSNW